MKSCIICGKVVDDKNGEVCETCKEFLEWKHKNESKSMLKEFKKLREQDRNFKLIKLRRKK